MYAKNIQYSLKHCPLECVQHTRFHSHSWQLAFKLPTSQIWHSWKLSGSEKAVFL